MALVSLTALNFAVQAEEGPSDVTSNQLFLNTFSPEEIDNYNHTQADPPQSNSQSDVDSNTSTAQNSQPSDHSFPTDTIQGHSAFTSSKSNLHVDTSQLAHHPHANKLHSAPNPPPKHEINAQPALSTPAYNPFIEYPPLTQTIQSIYQQYKPPINTQSGAYVLPSLPFPSLQVNLHYIPLYNLIFKKCLIFISFFSRMLPTPFPFRLDQNLLGTLLQVHSVLNRILDL